MSDVFQLLALLIVVAGVGLLLAAFIPLTGAIGAALIVAAVALWVTGREMDLAADHEEKLKDAVLRELREGKATS